MFIVQKKAIIVEAKDPGRPHRERVLSVTRRRPEVVAVTETVTVESAQESQIKELVEFWDVQFAKVFDMPDASMSPHKKRGAVEDILEEVNDIVRVKRMIVTLLSDERASWVSNKTLAWLASARNRTFLAPMLMKAGRSAEFRGNRTPDQLITFRK